MPRPVPRPFHDLNSPVCVRCGGMKKIQTFIPGTRIPKGMICPRCKGRGTEPK